MTKSTNGSGGRTPNDPVIFFSVPTARHVSFNPSTCADDPEIPALGINADSMVVPEMGVPPKNGWFTIENAMKMHEASYIL